MKGDFQTYRQAALVCIWGLIVQVLVGATLLVLSFLTGDPAAFNASLYVLLSVPVWLGLAIVFDQHKRERIEAMETEGLAAGPSSSVFESSAGEFRVAARRLAWMYKFFLPGLSLVIAAAMIGIGLWRASGAPDRMNALGEASHSGWSLALGLAFGLVGFIIARWVAGMAKQKVWTNLRGGAGAAIGMALFAGAIGLAHLIDQLVEPDFARKYADITTAALMIVLGGEIVFNFLLNLYRPRKAGEVPRPAFDSRMLSFVAAPDTIARSIGEAINYQLGYDVTGNWFYQLVSRLVLPLVLLGGLIIWGLSALVVVKPHERGMVMRFGSYLREVGPGLHVKLPWPIDRVETPVRVTFDEKRRPIRSHTTTGLRLLQLGSSPSAKPGPILWTNEHAGEEVLWLVQPVRSASGTDNDGGAAAQQRENVSVGLIALEIPMHYAIKDVKLFEQLAPPERVDDLLKSVAQREVLEHVSHLSVDEVLTAGQQGLGEAIKARVNAAFAKLNPDPATGQPRGAGIEVVSLLITKAHPPKDAASSFENVVQAEQRREARLESAQAERIATLTSVTGSVDKAERIVAEIDTLERLGDSKAAADQAKLVDQRLKIQQMIEESGGQAGATLAQARAERWQRHMSERARASQYEGQLASYLASPELFRATLLFDAMRRSWSGNRVYVVDTRVPVLRPSIDLKDQRSAVGVFDVEKKE
jgi:modulator of FtsH protease HflK